MSNFSNRLVIFINKIALKCYYRANLNSPKLIVKQNEKGPRLILHTITHHLCQDTHDCRLNLIKCTE